MVLYMTDVNMYAYTYILLQRPTVKVSERAIIKVHQERKTFGVVSDVIINLRNKSSTAKHSAQLWLQVTHQKSEQ